MGEKLFHAVATRIDVELVLHFQRVEFLMESPRALVEAETVLAAAIEVDLEDRCESDDPFKREAGTCSVGHHS